MSGFFAPGTSVAWRNCARVGREHQPAYATAMRVVHDRPGDLALYRGAGYPMRRRDAETVHIPDFRHQPATRLFDTWSADPDWGCWRVLLLLNPDARHAISLFWDIARDELDFWYIDLIGPARRRAQGFDFVENGLDIVVHPDLSSWRWKDEDELEWAVTAGVYTRDEADALYVEGRRAVKDLIARRDWFERWRSWRPPTKWRSAALPEGWDAV